MNKLATVSCLFLILFGTISFGQMPLNNAPAGAPFITNGTEPGIDAVSTGYSFSQSISSYSPISGGTLVASGAIDDASYANLPIGFTFNFNGAQYTTLGVTSNGYIWFGNVIPANGDRSPISQTVAVDGAVSAFGYDLIGLATGEIRIQTQGVSPARYCTVQFSNWASYNVTTDTLNFQIILYETGDSMQIKYGPILKDATSRSPQVGVRGPNNTDFHNRTTATDWTATTRGVLNSDVCTFINTAYPPPGLTFSFIPLPMVYDSSNTVQLLPGVNIPAGTFNNRIIQIPVYTSGITNPFTVTSFYLGTNGSTNPVTDISSAKLYYTGLSGAFATNSLFGSAVPNGPFTINGSQQLLGGTNYFWLTYDVPTTAIQSDTLDAKCDSIIIGGIARLPITSEPAGNRVISGQVLCGTKTIPGDYPNLSSAITALNNNGVCAAGVTFNVAAGFTETAANLVLSASGTSAGPIIFQKSGVGANPLITAGVGVSTTLDGMIKLSGADYVTFDGIDLQENAANTTTTTQMEWGYALLKVDGTDGSQNNTIKNCVITLTKTNTATIGIYSANHTIAATTALTVTSAGGANSNNKFYSNVISNVNSGIWIGGFSTNTFYDRKNEVGTTGSGQNRIFNYASTTTAYGVYGIYQDSIKVFNTNISNAGGAAATSTLYGIFLSTGVNSSADIYGDTVTVAGGGTTSQVAAIYNNMGTTGTSNTVNIYNNVVQNCSYTTATSGVFYHIYHSASSYNLNVYGNKIINNVYGSASVTATGTVYYLYILSGTSTNNLWSVHDNLISGNSRVQSAAGTGIYYVLYVSASVPTLNVYNNLITDNLMPTTTSTAYLFYLPGDAINMNCYNNTVRNITRVATTAATYCYYLTGGAAGGVHNIYNNSLNNLNFTTTGATYCFYPSAAVNKNIYQDSVYNITSSGSIYGIYHTGGLVSQIYSNKVYGLNTTSTIYGIYYSGTTSGNIYDNNIYNLTSTTGAVYGTYIPGSTTTEIYRNSIYDLNTTTGTIYGAYITGGTNNYFHNNFISDLQASASTSAVGLAGVYTSGGTNDYLFYNTIYLDAVSSSATTFGTAGVYASTTPVLDMRNNIIVNKSVPGPTGGFTTAYFRNAFNLATYASASNNNVLYVAPGAQRLLFYDGSNQITTLSAYKQLVTPRDANSFTENPPFINVSATPYNLHISGSTPTGLESAGTVISSPIAVTTDFDSQTRNVSTPDIGADEGTFILGDLLAPEIVYTPIPNTIEFTNRTLVANITDNLALQNTPPNDPRLYYKKGVNGTFKYRNKTSQAGNDFTFTLVVDSLGGLSVGDSVFYYVAAQDVGIGTPNIATNPSGGSGINPPGTTSPPSPNYYIITSNPMSGVYTIPGDYPTIAAAVAQVNLRGINGPVTFNVAQGHHEVAANITLTATGTPSYPIIFQKASTSLNDRLLLNNPYITAGTGTGLMDGIIKIAGADYVTFDGIDVRDTSANVNDTTRMEWGYALLKESGTNGSRNVTIKNCEIILDKTNINSTGIYSANHTVNSSGSLLVTDTLGTNSNNKFYSNTISNVNNGIWLAGFADVTPYTYYDRNNEIGSTGVLQNRIYNFGSTTTAYGIYVLYQGTINIFSTNINNAGGAAATAALYGIYTSTGVNSNVNIYNDTLTLVNGGTTGATGGIYNTMGATGTSNTINIYNNVVQNCTYDAAATGAVYYMYSNVGGYNVNIYGNKIINNTYGSASATATGALYYIYTFGGTASNNIWQFYNNVISNNSRVQSALGTGAAYLLYNSASGVTMNVYGNTISDNSLPSSSTIYGYYMSSSYMTAFSFYNNTIRNITRPNASNGAIYCIYHTGGAATGIANLYNNSINNINIAGAGTIYGLYSSNANIDKNIYQDTLYNLNTGGGSIYGLYPSSGITTNMYKNRVYGLSSTSGSVYGSYIGGGTTNNVYNNYISELQATTSTSATGVAGIYVSGGTTNNLFFNTIYLNAVSSSATTFGTAGIYTSTTPTVDMRNNIIDNVSVPGPTGGFTSAYQRSSATLTSYAATSNNNIFYAGSPSANRVLFYDGTTSIQSLDAYKTLVTPRDANSFTENPPFMNVTSAPYNLHISASTPTGVESRGIPVTTPIAINDDYDSETRNVTTPDIGADEGTFTALILPAAPLLISPPNGAVNQPISLTCVWGRPFGLDLKSGIQQNRTEKTKSLKTANIETPEELDAIERFWFEGVSDTATMANLLRDTTLVDSTKAWSGLQYQTSYFWRVKAKNVIGWGPFSGWFKFTTMPPPVAMVTLKVIPGGFYNSTTGRLNMKDTIKAFLIDSTGCLRSDSTTAVIDSVTFTTTISFTNAATGNYYLYVFHRNHIFIASRYEQSIIRGSTVSYDFTNDSTKAFGSNLIRVSSSPLLYGMIPGDANKDGYIDGFDQTIWINQNGLDGYLSSDFNGDLFVDGFDQTLWVLWNGQSYSVPCELTFESFNEHAKKLNEIRNNELDKIINLNQKKK